MLLFLIKSLPALRIGLNLRSELSRVISIHDALVQIKEAHQLDPKYDFDLCGKHSHNLIDFTETTPLTSLFNFDRCQYILAVLNERYQSNSIDNSLTPQVS